MENIIDDSINKIKSKLSTMNTELNKISYLENVIKEKNYTLDVKRFIFSELAKYYELLKMYRKAAKIMNNKANIEITKKDKIDSYLTSAELYSKLGDVDEAEQMFLLAIREASSEQKPAVMLAKKNIYQKFASLLEKNGKKASAIKFYEHLIKMDIDLIERDQIKSKLKNYYNSLGMFREAKLLE